MAEVILSTPSLSVLGGPASVNVQLESGAPGRRGSAIFFSNGNPNTTGALEELPQAMDLAINVLPEDSEYRYIYQYLPLDGNFSWQKMISLSPGMASFKISATFDMQGKADVVLPITNVISSYELGQISTDNLVINVSIVRDNTPIMVSVGTPSISVDENDLQVLSFSVYAAQADVNTSSISWLTGSHGIMCSISIGTPISPGLPI